MLTMFDILSLYLFCTTHKAAYPIIIMLLVNSLLYYYCFWCALLLLPHMMKICSQVLCDCLLPSPDFGLRFGSKGVIAFDTRKPITAPMTIGGKRSGWPPSSPSKRAIVRGSGKTAHATPAIPAVTATPSGMNVRILEIASPSVPPTKINGKMGPPSKPVANDVLVSRALISIIRRSNPMPKAAGLCMICNN
jgi:hypothetical protein